MEKITTGKYISLAYDISIVKPDGTKETIYSFTDKHPDNFVFGHEPGMLPAFMEGIMNLEQGQTFDFTLTPDKAFGNVNPEMIIDVPRSAFVDSEGNSHDDLLEIGSQLPMRFSDGNIEYGTITNITDEIVVMDFNPQLAGQTVNYVGTVLLVRDATEADLAPAHCGCGCDHDHGCGDGCDCGDHDHGCDCDHCHGCS